MRTSGKGHDGALIAVPVAVAVFIVVMVSGGPSAFLGSVEFHVRSFVDAVVAWLKAIF